MSDFVDGLAKLAETVGTLLGGPLVPAAVEIGKDVLNLIEKSKEVVETTDLPQLELMRDELEPKVMAHADITEQTLRG